MFHFDDQNVDSKKVQRDEAKVQRDEAKQRSVVAPQHDPR